MLSDVSEVDQRTHFILSFLLNGEPAQLIPKISGDAVKHTARTV